MEIKGIFCSSLKLYLYEEQKKNTAKTVKGTEITRNLAKICGKTQPKFFDKSETYLYK